jgi:hypothetical protein
MSLNITDAIFSRGERTPHAIAVIDAEGTVDYRTLCRGVLLAARRFREAGWKPDDRVGISLQASRTLHLISALALARMGITQVSLPATDPAPLRLARIGLCRRLRGHRHGYARPRLAERRARPGRRGGYPGPGREAALCRPGNLRHDRDTEGNWHHPRR